MLGLMLVAGLVACALKDEIRCLIRGHRWRMHGLAIGPLWICESCLKVDDWMTEEDLAYWRERERWL